MKFRRTLEVAPAGVEIEELFCPLDPADLFGNARIVEVEIGTGKGGFLTAEAAARPLVNFLGVERTRRYWKVTADRLRRNERSNARVVRGEAAGLLARLSAGSIAAVHVYFPDPWPKHRHRKRRLFQPTLAREIERVLVPAGRLHIVTDHREYLEQIEAALYATGLRRTEYRPPASAREGELAGSNFERKYRREGRALYPLAFLRAPDADSTGKTTFSS